MDVASQIIERLGGFQAVADMLGCHITRVYRWTYPTKRGGTGGHIPPKQFRKLLEKAPDKVKPADFFPTIVPETKPAAKSGAKPKRKRVA